MYSIGIIVLLTTDEKILFTALIVMMIIKYSYYLFNRCIMTYLEDGKTYASAAQLFGYTITSKKLLDETYEEIIINFALILIITKLMVLLLIGHYYK
tara:strand:- start:3860 stop:4150 length:291 start_codon:yes stop_codon:yes gene_type:complete